MATKQLSNYQLSVKDVYPRQSIYGFQLAPDAEKFTFVFQFDKRTTEVNLSGHIRTKDSALADLYLISVRGGIRSLSHQVEIYMHRQSGYRMGIIWF